MGNLLLFTDGSMNAQLHFGYGAYLLLHEYEFSSDSLMCIPKVKRFENTSSTKLELETLIWALEEVHLTCEKLIIYTDSQNVLGLAKRRSRLIQADYRSNKNRLLSNHELYRIFYRITEHLTFELVKVRGHLVSNEKNNIDRIFAIVDRAARKALREDGA